MRHITARIMVGDLITRLTTTHIMAAILPATIMAFTMGRWPAVAGKCSMAVVATAAAWQVTLVETAADGAVEQPAAVAHQVAGMRLRSRLEVVRMQ